MNQETRKATHALIAKLADLKEEVEAQRETLESLAEDEREKFDNLSEGLQASEKGEAIDQAANNLEEAYITLESAVDSIDETIATLEATIEE